MLKRPEKYGVTSVQKITIFAIFRKCVQEPAVNEGVYYFTAS
jgi:hypothetical protein